MPPEDNASSDFEFDSWAREFKLARSTTSILRREGCEDHTALTSLTRSDVLRLDLPVGQCRLLMVALADLGNKNTADFADSGRPEHEDQGADQPSGRRDNCEDEDVPDITSVRQVRDSTTCLGMRSGWGAGHWSPTGPGGGPCVLPAWPGPLATLGCS